LAGKYFILGLIVIWEGKMKQLYDILEYNKEFVSNKSYERFATTKFPDKQMAIVSCMDTRLVELLPQSMNLRNGDVKIIKNAGAIITHPFGSIMRSLVVAIYQLQAQEIFVISHYDCGMAQNNGEKLLQKIQDSGINVKVIETLENAGINLKEWLTGFDNVIDNVKNSVSLIKKHPLIPSEIPVHGLVIDPKTGQLDLVIDGYQPYNTDAQEKS
jgi:carbonic anhydrase